MTVEQPGRDCPKCPRLAGFRAENRAAWPDWHNAPVSSFGPIDASLLVVGLAPGLRGANRTSRPFTGDYACYLLYATLLETGFAAGTYGADPADGLELVNSRITTLPPAADESSGAARQYRYAGSATSNSSAPSI